jgi:hypothetical protein
MSWPTAACSEGAVKLLCLHLPPLKNSTARVTALRPSITAALCC